MTLDQGIQAIQPAPVRKTIHVRTTPDRAFDVFTRNMTRWWPRTHSIAASPLAEVVVEPQVGGRWFERGEDGSECDWGRVLAWEPPGRLMLAWQIDPQWRFNPDLVTEVELRFTADGEGTRVELEHRNLERMGEHAEAARAAYDSENGWSGLLDGFAAAADAD